ncbi:hypothetical protein PYW08_001208 [Mythimna loreyi]|uniref:Uncharacterized protein n=1 Tax=Mythimna loreyi TaxID=667449 RepID=A0ACC2R1V6_9NEOP|nr:hypothetical protein PYW08_001208 [Mythimna loreyi]
MGNAARMVNFFVPILFIFCINYVTCQTDSCNFLTCGECISYELERCVWCSKDEFNDRRCRPLSSTNTTDSWCKGGVVNPKPVSNTTQNKQFDSIVQLRPQEIKMKVRPGVKMDFTISFKPAEDYPLDVYYLMDISHTMSGKMTDLQKQASKIYYDLTHYTNNVQLGIGSFVEKPAFPFCDPSKHSSQAFKNEVPLTKNMTQFVDKIDGILFGSNFDDPEAGLDALMQAMKCIEQVGWRPEARRIIVLCTDSTYHSAGDGKIVGAIKPNDMKCHLENNTYSEALTYDYPSISQINRAAFDGNFGIIFAVTDNATVEYKELAAQIDGARYARLGDEDSVIEIIKKFYEEKANSAELKIYKAPAFVEVNIHQTCDTEPKENCESPHKQAVEIPVTLKVKSCPPNGAKDQIYDVVISPVGLPDKLTIKLEVDCKCDCEMETHPIKPGVCHGRGFMQCGICNCKEGSYGVDCRCNGSSTDHNDMEKCKKNDKDSKWCSGNGHCRCGICSCNPGFSGPFCEYDDNSCPRPNARLCSGHGICNLGKCHCDSNWEGEDCGCPKSKDTCFPPYSKKECSGKGKCVCGMCQCDKLEGKNETYSGAFCDNCEECPGQRCKELEKYAYCNYLNRNDKASCDKDKETQEAGKTSEIEVTFANKTEINGPKLFMAKWCKKDMDNGTYMVFKYRYENNQLKITIQNELETPPKANIYIAAGAAIGLVLLIGILTVIIWKILVDLHDKKEYQKFSAEALAQGYDVSQNPLYQDPSINFSNPVYNNQCN